jgi:MFS superfamily sulfate permease-like transporter
VLLRLLAVVVAQWLDLTTFVAMIDRRGPEAEANPFVARLLTDYGLGIVTIGKVALMLLVVSTIVILAGDRRRERYPRLAWIIVVAAVIAGMIGGLSNVATISA